MHCVSRGSRFYAFYVQLKSWQRYVLTVLTLISFVFCWHYFLYIPLEDVIAGYQHRSAHAQQIYNMAQNIQLKLEDQKKQLHRLQGQLNSQLADNSQQEAALSSVSVLANYAHQAGLLLRSCSCEGHQNGEWYKEVSLLFDATGSIDQLITFFDVLSQSKRVYGCSSLDIKRLGEGQLFQARCLFSEYLALG